MRPTQFIWAIAKIILWALVATNPFHWPPISLCVGIGVWCADMGLVLILSAHPITACVGVLLAGLFMAVPCFVWALPLPRGLLMCCMGLPLVVAVVNVFKALPSEGILFPLSVQSKSR